MLMGRLFYRPWELHRITWRDVQLAIRGYYEQNEFLFNMSETSTRLICMSGMNSKAATSACNKTYPKAAKRKPDINKGKDLIRRYREREALLSAKNKIDGRRSEDKNRS